MSPKQRRRIFFALLYVPLLFLFAVSLVALFYPESEILRAGVFIGMTFVFIVGATYAAFFPERIQEEALRSLETPFSPKMEFMNAFHRKLVDTPAYILCARLTGILILAVFLAGLFLWIVKAQ